MWFRSGNPGNPVDIGADQDQEADPVCFFTVLNDARLGDINIFTILSLLDVQTLLNIDVSFSSVSLTLVSVVLHFSVRLPRMSSKPHSANNIAHARRMVEQLRIEASIDRIKVQCNKPLLIIIYLLKGYINASSIYHSIGGLCITTGVTRSQPATHPPVLLCVVPVGFQGLCRPHELLQRPCEERPSPHGHPRLRQSLQGQKNLHYIVVDAT